MFQSDRDGYSQLYLMSADSSNVQRLTNTGADLKDFSPSWSSSGKTAFLRDGGATGTLNFRVINPDGSGFETLYGRGSFLDWSADGHTLVFDHYTNTTGSADHRCSPGKRIATSNSGARAGSSQRWRRFRD